MFSSMGSAKVNLWADYWRSTDADGVEPVPPGDADTDRVEPVPPGGADADRVEPVPPGGADADGLEPVPPGRGGRGRLAADGQNTEFDVSAECFDLFILRSQRYFNAACCDIPHPYPDDFRRVAV